MNSAATAHAALIAQQRAFSQALQMADHDAAAAHLGELLPPKPQGGPARFWIYRNAYRARLRDALKANYPVLHQVLGDEDFEALAMAYLDAHPSRHPSIRWFGHQLAAFVVGEPDALPHPALADLIAMEWALSTAFDSADPPPLAVQTLIDLPADEWPDLRLAPHPSVCLLPLDWNIEPLWSALSRLEEGDETPDTEAPEAAPHHLLVWRGETQTQWRSVEQEEAELLAVCLNGAPFSELCETAASRYGDTNAAARAAGYLRVWVEAGLLTPTVKR